MGPQKITAFPTEILAYPGEIYRIYTCLTVIPLPFCPAHEMLGDVPTIFNQTEGMESKRFFSLRERVGQGRSGMNYGISVFGSRFQRGGESQS